MAQWSDEAKIILESRYLKKDKQGKVIETPNQMLERVAKHVSEAEKTVELQKQSYDKFMSILDTLEFLPNSPTLMNAGRELGQLSACLSGDTLIRTCAGDFTIKELADKYKDDPDKKFDVYCATSFTELGIGKAFNPRLTRKNAEVYLVKFDDGSSLKATADHKLMYRNGKFGRVDSLTVGQSIMPFNYDYVYGYLTVFAGIDKYPVTAHKFVYQKMANCSLKSNEVIHHINFNHKDNSISNLKKMNKIEHFKWHSENFSGDNNPMRRLPELRKAASLRMMGNTIGKEGRPRTNNRYIFKGCCTICKKEFEKECYVGYTPTICSKECNMKNWAIVGRSNVKNPFGGKYDTYGFKGKKHSQEFRDALAERNYTRAAAGLYNHKVVSIEFYGCEDVYDMSVDKYHNFAANNVFVHNCFVLPIEDDLSNIFEMVKQVALIHKTGGGTGIVFSHLRPSASMVQSTSGVASGPVSFMRVFDTATDVVKQGGVRRGANMGCLGVWHPDIFDFVICKNIDFELYDKLKEIKDPIVRAQLEAELDKTLAFQNFNISVSITDNFLKAVKANNGFPLRNPYTKEKRHIKAEALFSLICHQAWLTGEPGLIFIDTINAKNPIPWMGEIEGTNPCGEQPLLPYESCNLGSIDVSKLVKDKKVDWDRLDEVVSIAVRFLDNVIDVNKYPNVKIARKTTTTRKVGLGIMGWADMLINLGVKYDSEHAVKLAKRLMMTVRETAHMTSRDIGKEKGFCFNQLKRRNSTLTTIAPTGTLSILADCSSGIEPLFGKEFTKTVLNGVKLDLGKKYREVDDKLLITSFMIPVEKHIEMQAAFQLYTDNAVSKTVNLQNSATEADVRKAFLLAHELGCKGITCYRDGSRKSPLEVTTEGALSECENGKCPI